MRLSGDFNLHERLSRQRNRHLRLTRASLLMLLAAVVCWLAGAGFALHLGISLLAGLVGLVWPVQGSRDWALTYISTQTGLAYETALVLDGEPRDAFGFRSGVRARARSGIAGLDQPRFSEWWLAAFILAAAIILLPALRLSAPWSADPPAPPPPASTATPLPEAAEEEPEDEPEPAPEDPAEEPEDEQLMPPQAEQQPGEPGEPASAPQGEAPGAEREGEVLDRFLDNLRERPREPDPATEIPGTPVPADAEQAEQADEETDDMDGTAPSDEAAEDATEGEQDGSTGAETAGGEDGQEQAELGEDEGPEEAAEPGEAADEAPQPGDAQTGQEDGLDPQDGQGLSEGDEDGDGAGAGPGLETPVDGVDRLQAEGDEEFLDGQLLGDEVNIGGDVRLPGFSEVELPPDTSPERLGEAVERSLTGGNVPLEYQEIIRNYFR